MTPAERLLREFGIVNPKDIDLELIAYSQGVQVKSRRIDGAEATITGHKNRAIVALDNRLKLPRRRFSLAHELGHWKYHRNKLLVCTSSDIGEGGQAKQSNREKVADQYASDLILPNYMFEPELRRCRELTLENLSEIADLFRVSLTATIIKAVKTRIFPTMVVCHGQRGRKWFFRGAVSDSWFPRSDLDHESLAMTTLYSEGMTRSRRQKIGADAWFDRRDAARYGVKEQSFSVSANEVISLITVLDEEMLEG